MKPTNAIPSSVLPFINHIEKELKKNKVKLNFSKTRLVDGCNGYFSDSPKPELAVAVDQPFEKWFPIFVHESCHFDQWMEQCPEWTNTIMSSSDSNSVMELWLNGEITLSRKQRENIIGLCRDCELDCERRAIGKIKGWKLPINPEYYAQRASAYIHFYNVLMETRRWYDETLSEPYNMERIVKAMPENLDGDYSKLPYYYREVFGSAYGLNLKWKYR